MQQQFCNFKDFFCIKGIINRSSAIKPILEQRRRKKISRSAVMRIGKTVNIFLLSKTKFVQLHLAAQAAAIVKRYRSRAFVYLNTR